LPQSKNSQINYIAMGSDEINNDLPSFRRIKSCLSVSTLEESIDFYNSNNTIKNKLSKQVSFHNLQIREYNIELGDNPSCSYGPPISMGWNYNDKNDIHLDELNSDNLDVKKPSHDAVARYDMLRDAGYTEADIIKSIHDVSVIKKQRFKASLSNEKSDKVNERIETITKTFKRVGNVTKMSRICSLNSLSLKLPRRNSKQTLQQSNINKCPLSATYHHRVAKTTAIEGSSDIDSSEHINTESDEWGFYEMGSDD